MSGIAKYIIDAVALAQHLTCCEHAVTGRGTEDVFLVLGASAACTFVD